VACCVEWYGKSNQPYGAAKGMVRMSDWILSHGGLVGLGVLLTKYTLIAFSMASVAVIIERVLALRRVRQLENRDFAAIRAAFPKGDWRALPELPTSGGSPCAAILATGLEYRGASEARLREAMNQETGVQLAALQNNLPILATTASTAPYVGLLGTVLGILSAFREIALTGQTGASVIAGGISEALTATALGLGVAIPAVMAYNYFTARVNALSLQIETHSLDIAEHLVVNPAPYAASPTHGGEADAHHSQ
jgi:biopolymer transport protein ExbB/TolQ